MSNQNTKDTPCYISLTLPFVFAGCLLVEMATGQPLFPGKTDIDQLWLIAKLTGYLTPQQLHHVQSAPGTARFKMPIRQMRDTLECRFPRLTYAQLEVVKVQTNMGVCSQTVGCNVCYQKCGCCQSYLQVCSS